MIKSFSHFNLGYLWNTIFINIIYRVPCVTLIYHTVRITWVVSWPIIHVTYSSPNLLLILVDPLKWYWIRWSQLCVTRRWLSKPSCWTRSWSRSSFIIHRFSCKSISVWVQMSFETFTVFRSSVCLSWNQTICWLLILRLCVFLIWHLIWINVSSLHIVLFSSYFTLNSLTPSCMSSGIS